MTKLIDRVYESQEPCAAIYNAQSLPTLHSRLSGIDTRVRTELESQGFKGDQIKTEKVLHMRFDGSDTALMISEPEDGDFETAFKAAYKTEFGFLLTSQIVVDDVKVSNTLFHATHDPG